MAICSVIVSLFFFFFLILVFGFINTQMMAVCCHSLLCRLQHLLQTMGAISGFSLSSYLVSVENEGSGQVCTLECKVLFIPAGNRASLKGKCILLGFLFLILNLWHFCMSSLLFDWYSNALSVCSVLVVILLRKHLMLCWLLPNHLSLKSNWMHTVFPQIMFILMCTFYLVFCCFVGS